MASNNENKLEETIKRLLKFAVDTETKKNQQTGKTTDKKEAELGAKSDEKKIQEQKMEDLLASFQNLITGTPILDLLNSITYLPQPIDYSKIKIDFENKLKTAFPEANPATVGIKLNLFNLSPAPKRGLYLRVSPSKKVSLHKFTKDMKIADHAKLTGKQTPKDALTISRIARCYANETREFLKRNVDINRIKSLGDLGFVNSYMCDQLSLEEKAKIFCEIKEWEKEHKTKLQKKTDHSLSESIKHYFKIADKKFTVGAFDEAVKNYQQSLIRSAEKK